MAEGTNVTIRLDQASADEPSHIVSALKKIGLEQIEVRQRFGLVNGTIAPDKLDELRAIDGVESVREDKVYSVR